VTYNREEGESFLPGNINSTIECNPNTFIINPFPQTIPILFEWAFKNSYRSQQYYINSWLSM